jgi:hypothetical protein
VRFFTRTSNGFVSLDALTGAGVVAIGLKIADPIIGSWSHSSSSDYLEDLADDEVRPIQTR